MMETLKTAGQMCEEYDLICARLVDLRACHDEHYAGMLAATAENERLRAALRKIRDTEIEHLPECDAGFPRTPSRECPCFRWSPASVARAALKEGE